MLKIGFTGHTNIERICKKELINCGLEYDLDSYNKIKSEIEKAIDIVKGSDTEYVIISGMARGIDELAALVCMERNMPLILSIPNSIKWHSTRGKSRNIKSQAINYSLIVKYVKDKISNGCKYSKINEISSCYLGKTYKYANEARNQNIIDASTKVLSYLAYPSTGTLDGIKKAKQKNKYYGNIPEII
jgi:uncharacterized phage-like protein YoqJ